MIKFADYQNKYRFYKLDRSDDGIVSVTFHTNGKSMVWGLEAVDELGHLWGDLGADRGNKVIVVTGTGNAFIDSMSVNVDISGEVWDEIASRVRRMFRNHLAIEIPMIAAVNGPALLHSEQALLCDIVIASEDAVFQDSPHFAVGMVPGDGVQVLYNHLLGSNRARYFHFMNEKIPAQRALEWGLISEIHARDRLQARALELARHILTQPELVRRYTRQVAIAPLRRLYAEHMDHGLGLEGLAAWGSWKLDGKG